MKTELDLNIMQKSCPVQYNINKFNVALIIKAVSENSKFNINKTCCYHEMLSKIIKESPVSEGKFRIPK